jgi:hypothetical protein
MQFDFLKMLSLYTPEQRERWPNDMSQRFGTCFIVMWLINVLIKHFKLSLRPYMNGATEVGMAVGNEKRRKENLPAI